MTRIPIIPIPRFAFPWVLIVLSVGLLATCLLFRVIRGWEERELAKRAEEVTREQVENLQVSVLRSLEVLHSIAALHTASGGIERGPFTQFVRQALGRQPEILALSWNPRVAAAARQSVEAGAVADGFPEFRFRERAPDGHFVNAETREEYVPVLFIEPLERNALALGYDLDSDPHRRASLEKARDAGLPVATAPLHLAQEAAAGPGLLVLQPVYHGRSPKDVEARRRQLAGYAVAVFRVADLVGRVFEALHSRGIEASLHDQSRDGEQLFGSPSSGGALTGRESETSLEVAGRRWTVVFAPNGSFTTTQSHLQSRVALIGGIAATLLAAAYLAGSWHRTAQVAAANEALQEEIQIRQRAEAAAAAANAAKSDFLASMSHEIRTPLNAILGYSQLIRRDPRLAPEQQDSIRGIIASGHHLLGLLNEILDLSKIEAGRMDLNPVEFDLSALGRDLAATFLPLCAAKGIRFRIDPDGGGRIQVRGDEGKLRQVLINLVGNAVKFTDRGGVYLGMRSGPNHSWQFEVIDTGLGIPESEQADIFRPFHQGSGARNHGGTGLGLAIADRQVELLGGHLRLDSERGAGSRFHFTVPLEPVECFPAANPPSAVRLMPGREITALVVDDHAENRKVLGGMLTALGCRVWTAADGEEALRLAREHRFNVVFLDLLLPGIDGHETARQLGSNPECGRPKIVAHTASALARHRDDALAAGCIDFIAKPVGFERLHQCLATHLGAEFELERPETTTEEMDPIEPLRIVLPGALADRISLAAELHSTTALKGCLEALRQLGPEERLLAEHIRHQMRSYDMDGIQRLILTVTSPGPTSRPPQAA